MGRLYIPAERQINGPWLLQRSDLEELDLILSTISEKLTQAYKMQKPTITNPLTKEKNIKIELISKDGRRNADKSIKGILKDTKVRDFKPTELYIHIEHGSTQNEFKLVVTSGIEGDLEYQIRCYDESIEEDIKYELETWIEKHEPNKLTQWWATLYGLIAFVGAIALLIMVGDLYETVTNYNILVNAHKLIDSGITSKNLNRAVEMILKIQSHYIPKGYKTESVLDKDMAKILSISLLIYIIWIFCPRTTIGIGKSVTRVKFYKAWLNIALVLVPGSIILPLLIDFIKNLLN